MLQKQQKTSLIYLSCILLWYIAPYLYAKIQIILCTGENLNIPRLSPKLDIKKAAAVSNTTTAEGVN